MLACCRPISDTKHSQTRFYRHPWIHTDRHKYIRGSDGSRELYDVRDDPDETEDLADTHGDVIAELDATLDEWLDSFDHADLSGDVEMCEEHRARLEDLGYL